ncbi:hypothetical protein Clacol_004616 [Clathrus columnatus]|uniref:Uncharacterized protein n=1 Tax=Clathrus columnatus TaxID=1419009 RepID=A0AAV5AEL0_9AGAM|nr:hypothetical protein Clacol_004616 [Clathrus columnatus]
MLVYAKCVINFVDAEDIGELEDTITPVDQSVLKTKLALFPTARIIQDLKPSKVVPLELPPRIGHVVDPKGSKAFEILIKRFDWAEKPCLEAGGVTINEDELQEELQQMIEEKEREEAEWKVLRENAKGKARAGKD